MAKDVFHNAVKTALQKDGWIITADPYEISAGNVDMLIDLGAENLLAAELQDQRIAVEIKSFVSASPISEFHTAHGQYLDYLYALEENQENRTLYLAVPKKTYDTFFRLEFIQNTVQRSQIRLIVYDPEQETIVQWL
jgi:glucose-6-phosphate 1-dehydrogenase